MLRSAISAFTRGFDALWLAAWCAADPGSTSHTDTLARLGPGSAEQRTGRCGACHRARVRATRWHRRESGAPRPGHDNPHIIVRGNPPPRLRFPTSVVFKSFTLFAAFSFLSPRNGCDSRRGNLLV